MRGYRDISKDIGVLYRMLIRFCDDGVGMRIVKVSFRERSESSSRS